MKANFFLSLAVTAGALALSDTTWSGSAIDTPKKPVATEYHDVTVKDPYQWLESDDDAEVKAWSDAQNQQTRKYLDSFPDRAAIEKQLQEWYAKTSPSYFSLVSRPATGRIRRGELAGAAAWRAPRFARPANLIFGCDGNTKTGQGACRTTRSAMLPINTCFKPVNP